MESKTVAPQNFSPTPPPSMKVIHDIVCSQKFMDFLSTFPKHIRIFQLYSYQYQGFWYYPFILQGLIDFQSHFQPLHNDIFLITNPKSVTTWLKAIVYALINRKARPPQHAHHPLFKINPHELVPFIEFLKPSEYNTVSNSSDNSDTRIFISHSPTVSLPNTLREDNGSCNLKIMYLCREIKDTLVLYFHFSIKSNMRSSPISLEDAFDLFCKGVSAIRPVWDHILGYWKESMERPHQVLFMKYEELKNESHLQMRSLAHFIGNLFSEDAENLGLVNQIINLSSFENMSRLEVNKTGNVVERVSNSLFFRSGVIFDGRKAINCRDGC